jgi:hypothetical protein
LLNSQPIRTSWGTAWNFRSHYISGKKPAWISVAMVQFIALWIVVIQNLRTVRFHFPRRSFLSGFFCVTPVFRRNPNASHTCAITTISHIW